MRCSLISHFPTLSVFLLSVPVALFAPLSDARADPGRVTGALATETPSAQGRIVGDSLPRSAAVPILVFSVVAITVFRRRVRQ